MPFADRAEDQRLIRTIARKGLRFIGDVREEKSPTDVAEGCSALLLPDSPSIAVLPFNNLSGDPEQDYFADGIVEEIITALSRFQPVVRHRAQFKLHVQGSSHMT